MMNKPLILAVDDEPAILTMLKGALEDEHFRVETLSDGSKVLDTIGKLVPDVVLLDIFMPNFDGLQMLKSIKQEYPTQHVILISGFGTIPLAIQAMQEGALSFIEKPFTLSEVLEKLAFTKTPELQQDSINAAPRSYLVGESALFNELLSQARILATLSLPMIIYGPPGSGKTALAQYIHDVSPRAEKPFIVVTQKTIQNIDPRLLNQETTLVCKNLERADEDYQAALFDLLTQHPLVRVIGTSASTLFSRMQQGLFDSSLFCKLNAIPLEIAAITKRRYDIPLLVNNFLSESNKSFSKDVSLSSDAMRLLRNHTWTGDVAHIKQFIHQLVAQSQAKATTVSALTLKSMLPESPGLFCEEQSFTRFNSLNDATHQFQREYLAHLLKRYQYDTSQLAEFLNISVDSLHETIHNLHITLH